MYLIAFLLILLFILVCVASLLFLIPLKVSGTFHSEQEPDVHALMTWLSPFLKSTITRERQELVLTVFLFNKKLFERTLNRKKTEPGTQKIEHYTDYFNYIRLLELDNSSLNAAYGFVDPAAAGILCGAIDFISQYIHFEVFNNNADFFTDFSYFNIFAEAEVNMGISLTRILRVRYLHTHKHVLSSSR